MPRRAPDGRARLEIWLLLALSVPLAACERPPAEYPHTARLLPADPQADTNASGFLSFGEEADTGWPVTLTLSGLTAGEIYRLTLNGYPGDEPTNAILAECPIVGKLDSGRYLDREGYCDFRTVMTNDAGTAMEKLTLPLPPSEYRLKFFVKKNGGTDGRDYHVVLKADELRFTILRPAWRPPVGVIVALVAAVLITAGVGVARLVRTRRTPGPPLPAREEPRAGSVPSVPQYVFRRSPKNRDVWEIGELSQPTLIPHVDGFGYISLLVRKPGEEILAQDLYWSLNPPPPTHAAESPSTHRQALARGPWSPQGQVMDDATVRESLRELDRHRATLKEIESGAEPDAGKADEVQGQIDAIERYLKSRGRAFANQDAEKSRVTVAKALTRAYEKIEEHDSALARHLKETIHSGGSLSYRPKPESRVNWIF
jgi:hypothetical protein